MQLKKHLTLLSLAMLWLSLVAGGQAPGATNAKPPRSVTGHYVMRREEFRNRLEVLQLPGGKIKFDLVALWVSHYNPDNVHNGEIQAIVSLENGVAVYQAGDCRLRMEFLPTRVPYRRAMRLAIVDLAPTSPPAVPIEKSTAKNRNSIFKALRACSMVRPAIFFDCRFEE